MSAARLLAMAATLAAGLAMLALAAGDVSVARSRQFREFPSALGEWSAEERPIAPRLLAALGADDHLSRVYAAPGQADIDLFLAYYGSQRVGDLIHSPKHCLPGAGWEPIRTSRLQIDVPGVGPEWVNEYLVQKGEDRQLVLYWYQGRGRMIANEYWAKFWMVHDSLTRRRTDCALVRIVTTARDGDAEARARAVRFAAGIFPLLNQFIPN